MFNLREAYKSHQCPLSFFSWWKKRQKKSCNLANILLGRVTCFLLKFFSFMSAVTASSRGPLSMKGCCVFWAAASSGSRTGLNCPRRCSFPNQAPFWRSGPQCCRCTKWPSPPWRRVSTKLRSIPAGPQSLGLWSQVAQRRPLAGMRYPTGPWV